MQIIDLKNLIAGYLDQTNLGVFTINTEDTLLVALNNARKTAERAHDFYYSQADAYLSVSTSAGNPITGAKTTSGGNTAISIKRIRSAQLAVSDGYIPIEFMRHDEYISRQRKQVGREPYIAGNTMASYGIATENPIAVQHGQTLYLAGATFTYPIIVKLDVVQWMPDYANNTDEDFFVDFGSSYLQWQAILEGNRYWQRFVPKQEGAVMEESLTDAASVALQSLIEWDTDIAKGTSSTGQPQPKGRG
jgi:hypothetical protein